MIKGPIMLNKNSNPVVLNEVSFNTLPDGGVRGGMEEMGEGVRT
jgi:hypothetical protein